MTLIKDLLNLPERVDKSSFVLNLAAGVEDVRAAETLKSYVVTPQLADCFDRALKLIRSGLEGNASKACYLHGSFGSGKSHFMAVLYLLLRQHTTARAIPELAAVVAQHNEWTTARKFLMVPFHMIGAENLEQGILSRYAEHVRKLRPTAPVPGVYLADSLFADAQSLRQDLGDGAFFQRLNAQAASTSGSGWGAMATPWDAGRFDAALQAPPGSPDRTRLVGDLIQSFFRSYHQVAAGHGEAFVDLDHGLAAMSQHAKELGYDALVLFLDELVIWLASHAADLDFIHRETQKLVKLVEAQSTNRPIPIISFVARQRDLRTLIGEAVSGSQQVNYGDSVDWSGGRFETIKLEDRNLPVIANKRILQPRSEATRQELAAAFDSLRRDVLKVLLADQYDEQVFRLIYPFSPALMETLVAASGMLQRERTALKVMQQLLVEQRDSLKVGDIVPVGDLYDAVAQGDEAFSQDMRVHFDNARRLYQEKLLPMLEGKYNRRREELLQQPADSPERGNFTNDERLLKTLLLAALVPGVRCLRNLTAVRLAALNHGSVRTPIPGREAATVLQKCKEWAAQVGEIKIGEDATNPTIALQLSGVDTEAILAAASHEDNLGNQVRTIKAILFAELGIEDTGELFLTHELLWRNTTRACEIIFGNVRGLPDVSYTPSGGDWKLIIDYPVDAPNRTTRDDLGKLQLYRQQHPAGARTLVWLPAFFTTSAKKDLSQLVILEHVLTGERLESYAQHLALQDRHTAKTVLENQRSALRERVRQHIEAAYGVRGSQDSAVDGSHSLDETFRSLHPGLVLQPPAQANLREVFQNLLDQALTSEFPAHPQFGVEVKRAALKKVEEETLRAVAERDGRIEVERTLRPLMKQLAEPLLLGEQGETHFVLGQHWKEHFHRKAAEAGVASGAITVLALRKWLDDPQPRGLPLACQNLIILVFAAQTNRSFALHGGPFSPTLENLPDALELKPEALPAEQEWTLARDRAGHIFGLSPSPLLNVANLARLAADVQAQGQQLLGACRQVLQQVNQYLRALGADPASAPRCQTAGCLVGLLTALPSKKPNEVVALLASREPQTSATAMGTALKSAPSLANAIGSLRWTLFEALQRLEQHDPRRRAADIISRRLKDALSADELVTPLGPALEHESDEAIKLLASVPPPVTPPPPPPPSTAPAPVVPQGQRVVATGTKDGLSPDQAADQLKKLKQTAKPKQKIRVNMSWTITEE